MSFFMAKNNVSFISNWSITERKYRKFAINRPIHFLATHNFWTTHNYIIVPRCVCEVMCSKKLYTLWPIYCKFMVKGKKKLKYLFYSVYIPFCRSHWVDNKNIYHVIIWSSLSTKNHQNDQLIQKSSKWRMILGYHENKLVSNNFLGIKISG